MDELKKKTMSIILKLEQDIVERINKAIEKDEGIDLIGRNAKLVECLNELDLAHIEAKQRSKKKGGIFGK